VPNDARRIRFGRKAEKEKGLIQPVSEGRIETRRRRRMRRRRSRSRRRRRRRRKIEIFYCVYHIISSLKWLIFWS
jgi:hypothetical protein